MTYIRIGIVMFLLMIWWYLINYKWEVPEEPEPEPDEGTELSIITQMGEAGSIICGHPDCLCRYNQITTL